MNILVVNDDGIKALGLKILVESLKPFGNIYVFAPEKPQSGKSHSVSFSKELKIKHYKNLYGANDAYSIEGTPADSLRMALFIYQDIKFNFVVSGINDGPNIGSDVLRSGTVGAASEAAILGLPAVAVSSPFKDFKIAKEYTYSIIKYLYENNYLTNEYILSINYPTSEFREPKNIVFTTQGKFNYPPVYHLVKKNVYKGEFNFVDKYNEKGTDVFGFFNGDITITPIYENRSLKETVNKLNNKSKLNEIIIYDKINSR